MRSPIFISAAITESVTEGAPLDCYTCVKGIIPYIYVHIEQEILT